MTFPISGCTIIRDAIKGAFCLFESLVMMLPIVDDIHIMDMGSTDGTLDILHDIALANKRIHIHSKVYPWENPSVLATASNDVIALADHDDVLFWQADEIWHEQLIRRMTGMFEQGQYNLIFWRYQLRDNLQKMHWLPHIVHRVGNRKDGMFEFVGDGMTTKRMVDVVLCSEYHSGSWRAPDIPTHDMILDVCSLGAFRDNIVQRKECHHPLWGESSLVVEGIDPNLWMHRANADPDWTKTTTPFSIPKIMHYHVGRPTYEVRPGLIDAIKDDWTKEYLNGI